MLSSLFCTPPETVYDNRHAPQVILDRRFSDEFEDFYSLNKT